MLSFFELVPIVLFPIYLVLSFFTRKNKKAFISVFIMGILMFLLTLYFVLIGAINVIKTGSTYWALESLYGVIIFIGYEIPWIFMPIKWRDSLLPILILGIAFLVAMLEYVPIILYQLIFLFGFIYCISLYFRYIPKNSRG